MGLPKSVQTYLDEQSICFHIEEATNISELRSADSQTIRSSMIGKLVLLKDSIGVMQVLLPSDVILDLSLLCELLGRNLQAMNTDEEKSLMNKLGLIDLPGLPLLRDYETIVEDSLLELPEVYFSSGIEGQFVRLGQEQFAGLVGKADVAHFCVPATAAIAAIEHHQTSNDEEQISQAVEQFTSLRIKQRLVNTLEVPPMPDSAERIIRLRVNPDAGVGELAQVVGTDPSLAAQVVSWAASPYYAAPGKIASVHDAVVRVLGFDLVINLALGLALGKTLEIPKDGPKGITPYWQNAVFSAATMEALVRKMPADKPCALGMAYLSGLLSNFGFLILAHVFPPHFSLISRFTECNKHVPHNVIDQHVLGVTREQISSWLMSSWNMPEEVVTALRWQMNPNFIGEMDVYPNLLFLTGQLLRRQGIGEGPVQNIPDSLYERLGLDEETALAAMESVMKKSESVQDMAQQLS